MEAWKEALRPIEPAAIADENATVLRASRYEHLDGLEGWRDFVGVLTSYRRQLERALLDGKFATAARPNATTDDDLRAMLFMCDRLLAVRPAVAAAYDLVRERQAARDKALARAESWSASALA